ncbi:MAG: WecB/TagA/CpsF family glycosyltransferase [Verrucomicrobiales bacterium]
MDRTAAPIAMLGVPFDNVTTGQTIQLIEQMVSSGQPHYLATANVDFLVQAMHDVELRRILFDAHLVLCDGTPLVWASKLLGNPLPERVAGSDLVPLLMKVAAEKGYRPFFLGATEDSAKQAIANLTAKYPSLQMAGYYSPPFNKLLEMDHEEITRRITEAKPDMLFVGFGCPKQEKWISMHYRSLGVPVSVGIGGTIDFLAGKLQRAPKWMQKTGTEWIFRLAQEPKRLFKRYCGDLWYFSRAILQQYWQFSSRSRKKIPAPVKEPPAIQREWRLITFPDRIDFEAVHQQKNVWEQMLEEHDFLLADLSNVEFVDSTGVGFLIRLQKRARLAGKHLLLLQPTVAVSRALAMMRLQDFFTIVPTLEAAKIFLEELNSSRPVQVRNIPSSSYPSIIWKGELTAANADEVWNVTMTHLNARALVQKSLAIDMSELRFLDSTGLSVMIKAKKFASRQGLSITFTGIQPNVRNVVKLARLEDYLFSQS